MWIAAILDLIFTSGKKLNLKKITKQKKVKTKEEFMPLPLNHFL